MTLAHHASDAVLTRRSLADPAVAARLVHACECGDKETLLELIVEPELREAIEIASPSLSTQLDRFAAGRLNDKRTRRMLEALLRYGVRMRNRATPMGVFAAVGVTGVAAPDADVEVKVTRSIRPSGSWCVGLGAQIGQADEALLDLRVTASRAVYSRTGALIVLGADHGADHGAGYSVTQHLPLTRAILDWCDQWRPALDVVAFTAQRSGAPQGDARDFVLGLIRHGVLVSELAEVALTTDPFAALQRIANNRGAEPMWSGWAGLHCELVEIRRQIENIVPNSAAPPEVYRSVRDAMAKVHEPADLHVDATFSGPAPAAPSPDLYLACQALALVSPIAEHPVLTAATKWFTHRYSDTHTLRLAEMFTPGNGFDPTAPSASHHEHTHASPYATPAINEHELLSGTSEVDLVPMLGRARLRAAAGQLPRDFLAMVEMSASSTTPRPTRLRHVSTGLQLVGRFAHLDIAIAEFAREFVRAQETGEEVVRAEIRCPCAGRSQNIALRPVLRRVCIDFGPPTTGSDELGRPVISLPVKDLLVRFVGGRLQLFSERLGCRVVPSAATAVVFHRCQYPAAAFLTLLSGQESQARQWSWQKLNNLPSLPRLVAGDVVIAPRQWTITTSDLEQLRAPSRPAYSAAEQIAETRFVTTGSAESPLLIDVGTTAGLEQMERRIRASRNLLVQEAAAPPMRVGQVHVLDRPATEMVIPFHAPLASHTDPGRATICHQSSHPPAPRGPIPRFGPGSRWASFKIYGRAEQLETLLACILPLITAAQDTNLLRRWFFIHYSDPDYHLRLRFTGAPAQLWGRFVPELWKLLRRHDLRWDRALIDEYRPETDRYGGPRALLLAEELFGSSSELAAGLGSIEENERLDVALLTTHQTLSALGFSDSAARDLIAAAERARAERHGMESARIEAGRRARQAADLFERLRGPATYPVPDEGLVAWATGLDATATHLRPLLDTVPGRLSSVTQSLLHMHCNRLFPIDPNYWEVVVYSMLRRAYDRAFAGCG